MFANDRQLDPVAQKMKHFTMKAYDQQTTDDHQQKKQYRIRSLLKEKRETIAEYVSKKREIFLANMNINIKKEETNRLEDFIKNE